MTPIRVRAIVSIGLQVAPIAPIALLAVACSRPPEQQFLNQFFRAARSRDNTTLAMMSAVVFDPRDQGEVSDFEITNVSEESRTPLDLKGLLAAAEKATATEADVRKQRLAFEAANRPALEAIAKLERAALTPGAAAARFTAAQQALKATWDQWRADAAAAQKATTAARAALNATTGPAEASLTQPGQPPFAADKFEGALVSKDVTLNAQVRSPDGQTAQKVLVVTIQRVEGTLGGTQRTGRPIITKIQGA